MAEHPITPPPELVRQWCLEAQDEHRPCNMANLLATQAARWGADQELEACCLLLDSSEHAATYGCHDGTSLRIARRPKPPSLKEQALMALEDGDIGPGASLTPVEVCTIRRALEALPE